MGKPKKARRPRTDRRDYNSLKSEIITKYSAATWEGFPWTAYLFADLYEFSKEVSDDKPDVIRTGINNWLQNHDAASLPIELLVQFIKSKYWMCNRVDLIRKAKAEVIQVPLQVWYDCGIYGEKCNTGGHMDGNPDSAMLKSLAELQMRSYAGIFEDRSMGLAFGPDGRLEQQYATLRLNNQYSGLNEVLVTDYKSDTFGKGKEEYLPKTHTRMIKVEDDSEVRKYITELTDKTKKAQLIIGGAVTESKLLQTVTMNSAGELETKNFFPQAGGSPALYTVVQVYNHIKDYNKKFYEAAIHERTNDARDAVKEYLDRLELLNHKKMTTPEIRAAYWYYSWFVEHLQSSIWLSIANSKSDDFRNAMIGEIPNILKRLKAVYDGVTKTADDKATKESTATKKVESDFKLAKNEGNIYGSYLRHLNSEKNFTIYELLIDCPKYPEINSSRYQYKIFSDEVEITIANHNKHGMVSAFGVSIPNTKITAEAPYGEINDKNKRVPTTLDKKKHTLNEKTMGTKHYAIMSTGAFMRSAYYQFVNEFVSKDDYEKVVEGIAEIENHIDYVIFMNDENEDDDKNDATEKNKLYGIVVN